MRKTIADLQASKRRLCEVLLSVADRQDWRPAPDEWSFREIAAHLEATQRECVLVRVRQIASGSHPRFEYYRNDGRDFGSVDLQDSLRGFAAARRAVRNVAAGLSPEQQHFTGQHQTFGELTIQRYLEIDLEHDQGHLRDLERYLLHPAS
ncbi:MAG: DinB family protein [Chloroflexi bacterium]|nr:MAG: DinB family protein [Chloroflexota bacterium]